MEKSFAWVNTRAARAGNIGIAAARGFDHNADAQAAGSIVEPLRFFRRCQGGSRSAGFFAGAAIIPAHESGDFFSAQRGALYGGRVVQ